MTLKEIIDLEEKFLEIEKNKKTELDFNDVLFLKKYLFEIASITDTYFELMDEKKFNTEEEVLNYSNLLLKTDIDDDLLNVEKILLFKEYILKKYEF